MGAMLLSGHCRKQTRTTIIAPGRELYPILGLVTYTSEERGLGLPTRSPLPEREHREEATGVPDYDAEITAEYTFPLPFIWTYNHLSIYACRGLA